MTIKGLLSVLFLYVCLAWVGAGYLYSGPQIVQTGLLWTAIGLIAALALVLISRIWTVLSGALAKRRAAPKRPAKPETVQAPDEDEAAIVSLLHEANVALTRIRGPVTGALLGSMPTYLLVGPSGSGKTTTLLNSGLDPELLAGRVTAGGPVLPTQLCNIWLARQAIFIELSGRLFGGDSARWTKTLKALSRGEKVPRYRLRRQPPAGLQVSAVVAFTDAKDFIAATNPPGLELLERQGKNWQERLRAISDVFGTRFPAYLIVSKSDNIPYFPDYVRRISQVELEQTLGCTLAYEDMQPHGGQNDGERVTKALRDSFSPLYHSLAKARLNVLALESEPSRRAAIYEFPRELKRLKSPLTQFLNDVFKPHPTKPGPVLRGYYFCGVGEGSSRPDATATGVYAPAQYLAADSTVLFRGDATRIFRGSEGAAAGAAVARAAGAQQWLFVTELFLGIVSDDRPEWLVTKPVQSNRAVRLAAVCVCAVCALLCFAMLISWSRNRNLLNQVADAAALSGDKRPTLASLRSLDGLRIELGQLLDSEEHGAPWSSRWGLYSGNAVLPAAKAVYFRRFQELLLNGLDRSLLIKLDALPPTPGPNDAYQPAFDTLKAHLMISSSSCSPEPAFVARVLGQTLAEATPAVDSESQSVARRQIDFYADQLKQSGNPCRLLDSPDTVRNAQQYLQRVQGPDRLYAALLSAAQQQFPHPQRLADLAPNYAQVLSGLGEIDGAFNRDSFNFTEGFLKKGNPVSAGQGCVTGQNHALFGGPTQDAELKRGVERLFIHAYGERWRAFVAGFSVIPYSGAADAARKLEILSDHKSPLLAVLAMTSSQTNIAVPSASDTNPSHRLPPMMGGLLSGLKGSQASNVEKQLASAGGSDASQTQSTPSDITRLFQPVHVVVPPGSDTWVVTSNSAYIDSLAELSHAMQAIADGSRIPDPAVHQSARQAYEKALDAARQIAKKFEPVGVEGLDVAVENLLYAPIKMTDAYIIRDLDSDLKKKLNGEMHGFCAGLKPMLHKYPFASNGPDASVAELNAMFAPGTGAIWKFQQRSLAELTLRDGAVWKAKEGAKEGQTIPEVVAFLNKAQSITDAFYPNGSQQPALTYTLRPRLDPSVKDWIVELEVDGQRHDWTSAIQKQFNWPGDPSNKDSGATGRLKTGSASIPFASRGGQWGIFRLLGDAEPRPLGSRLVEWRNVRGGDGRLEPIQPAPVRLEIVEFPGGADIFNPKFYEGLQCPNAAVQ